MQLFARSPAGVRVQQHAQRKSAKVAGRGRLNVRAEAIAMPPAPAEQEKELQRLEKGNAVSNARLSLFTVVVSRAALRVLAVPGLLETPRRMPQLN